MTDNDTLDAIRARHTNGYMPSDPDPRDDLDTLLAMLDERDRRIVELDKQEYRKVWHVDAPELIELRAALVRGIAIALNDKIDEVERDGQMYVWATETRELLKK